MSAGRGVAGRRWPNQLPPPYPSAPATNTAAAQPTPRVRGRQRAYLVNQAGRGGGVSCSRVRLVKSVDGSGRGR